MNIELLSKDDLQGVTDRMERLDRKFDLILDLLREGQDRMLDMSEICRRLGISENSFYRLSASNRLPFLIKVGNRWKAREKDLNDFLNTHKDHEEKRN